MDMSRHPATGAPVDDPRARIVDALWQRAGGAAGQGAPVAEIAADPAQPERPSSPDASAPACAAADGVKFTRERQVEFLDNLSLTGSVRAAAAAAGVSHQTVYRARRAEAGFRTAWDGALLAARSHAEAVLAARAIDGVSEPVFYHGEVIATRIRYSDRLLLAHLARLDRLDEAPAAAAVAQDWDAAMARFARGEDPAPAPPATAPDRAERTATPAGEILPPEPCNIRSTPPCDTPAGRDIDADAEPDAAWFEEDESPDWGDPEDYGDVFAGESAADAKLPIVARILTAMERTRPADAPNIADRWPMGALEAEQMDAFMARHPQWWLVVPPGPGDDAGEYCLYTPPAR